MCGSEPTLVWTYRVRATGRLYESERGYRFFFETEEEARENLERARPPVSVEIVRVKQDEAG